jgi:hydroxypyruvate isomerase
MLRPHRRHVLGITAGLALAPRSRVRRAQDEDEISFDRTRTRFAVNAEIWWSRMSFADRIREAASWGFPAIEFWPWRNKDLGEIEKVTKDLGVEVAQFTGWGFEPGMNDPANHAKVVEEIKEACKAAVRLSCKEMTVVAGNDQPGMTKSEMHAHVITALKLAAPIARDHDVTLILEPMNGRVDHPRHCLYGSADAVKICEAVASDHVKINWDLYHMQLAEGDLCGRLREGFKWLGYAQVADTPGRHEPGTGEINYSRVLKELHDLGYRGFVGLECWPRDGEEEAIRRIAAADQW